MGTEVPGASGSAQGRLGLAPESLKRVKARIRRITRRNRGISLEGMIHELNSFPKGWVIYSAMRSVGPTYGAWMGGLAGSCGACV